MYERKIIDDVHYYKRVEEKQELANILVYAFLAAVAAYLAIQIFIR